MMTKKITQPDKLANYLEEHKYITADQAKAKLGIVALSGTVTKLSNRGWVIEHERGKAIKNGVSHSNCKYTVTYMPEPQLTPQEEAQQARLDKRINDVNNILLSYNPDAKTPEDSLKTLLINIHYWCVDKNVNWTETVTAANQAYKSDII